MKISRYLPEDRVILIANWNYCRSPANPQTPALPLIYGAADCQTLLFRMAIAVVKEEPWKIY